MLNISHQENPDKNEIELHAQLEWMKLKRLTILSVGNNVEYKITHDGNIKLDNQLGKQICTF